MKILGLLHLDKSSRRKLGVLYCILLALLASLGYLGVEAQKSAPRVLYDCLDSKLPHESGIVPE